jgi:hypothetical protein
VGRTRLDLIPVALAARSLYERAYGTSPPDAHLLERLNGLAYRLASFGPVYAMDDRRSTSRVITDAELAAGHFTNGATELRFVDGRAPILRLAVPEHSIAKAVEALLRT